VLSGYPLARLSRIMVFAWTLTLLPPLVDFLAGTSSAIGYFPLDGTNAVHYLLGFFNPAVVLPGTTTGIRVEAAIGCLLAGVFSWGAAENRRILRGAATTLIMAPVFLVFFVWPNLVYVLLGRLFPDVPTAQEFYQWHAATTPHLTGEFHYTIFLVDLLPVLAILSVFLRKLRPGAWAALRAGVLRRPWTLLAPTAGALCAAASAGWILTFADVGSILGAAMAAWLTTLSFHAIGRPGLRGMLIGAAITTAAAVSWLTVVLVLLAAAISMLPGPRRLAAVLTAAASVLAACSPTGLGISPALAAAVGLAGLSALAAGSGASGAWLGAAAAAAALLLPGTRTPVCLEFHRELVDSFNRNGRQDMALPASSAAAGCGGDMLSLARAELSAGSPDKARWAYGLALADGDSSADAARTGLYLAGMYGRPGELDSLLASGAASREDLGSTDLAGWIVENAAKEGDTLLIAGLLDTYGSHPLLLASYSMACAAHDDMPRAAAYARAAASHPLAEAAQVAWAIHLTALEGGPFDSVYAAGAARFPGSVELMTSRLTAPMAAGLPPDREDLLETCLALRPFSPSVLRTAAAWRLANGEPGEALEMAERAIAVERRPVAELITLACEAALEAGDPERLRVHAAYGQALYPDRPAWAGLIRMADDGSVPGGADAE